MTKWAHARGQKIERREGCIAAQQVPKDRESFMTTLRRIEKSSFRMKTSSFSFFFFVCLDSFYCTPFHDSPSFISALIYFPSQYFLSSSCSFFSYCDPVTWMLSIVAQSQLPTQTRREKNLQYSHKVEHGIAMEVMINFKEKACSRCRCCWVIVNLLGN